MWSAIFFLTLSMIVDFEKDFKEQLKLKFLARKFDIGLDIDEVLADFIGGYNRYAPGRITKENYNWHFSYGLKDILAELNDNRDFWTNLTPLISHMDIPFIPKCYITKRNFPVAWTEEWIEKNHFPCVPVIHVPDSKVAAYKEQQLDYYIDDSIKNFQELNSEGCKTFLMDAVHNKQFSVGEYRLYSLHDIINKI